MRGEGMLLPGALALTSGAVGIATAVLSLMGSAPAMMALPMGESSLPAALLLIFGFVVLVNGLLLVVGVRVAPRPQGGLMFAYGVLMLLVGGLMVGTPLFAMAMAAPASAVAMFLLGGLMVVSGGSMAAGRGMVGG